MRALLVLGLLAVGHAETGRDAWLRYAPVEGKFKLPPSVVLRTQSPVSLTARNELVRGVKGMYGRTLRIDAQPPAEGAIILQTASGLKPEAFRIRITGNSIHIEGGDPNGILYGTFALLRKLAAGETIANVEETPHSAIRWINHWDNLDGTIERGYGGRSIFWENGTIRADLTRVNEYARLLASVGINACSINNVNANIRAIDTPMLPELKPILFT
jgi:alpha-glucuronidase